jgi:hypothetical protein
MSMKTHRLLCLLLFGVLLSCAPPVSAQLEAFRFDAARVPVGKVFHFEKSQLDGGHATKISVYLPAIDRVEALKWDQGGDQATLVVADIDWSKFSVKHFEAWHLVRGSAPERRATVDVTGDELSMSLMSRPLTLSHWPWHSYDFDFTSLNVVLPQLADPEGTLRFWRTDFVYSDPPVVDELGEVTMRFEARQRRHGVPVRRYSLGGPGLQNLYGTWWADARTGLLVEYELPVGDEPGYDNVRLRLESARKLSHARWEAFKRRALGE